MSYPSSLRFISLLRYSPHGTTALSRFSKNVCRAFKDDSFVRTPEEAGGSTEFWVIPRAAMRLKEEMPRFEFLSQAFGPESLLVPVPRSAPLKDERALWPARSICRSIVSAGLAGGMAPLLVRTNAVQKAAFATPGKRPSPSDHYNSTKVADTLPLGTFRRIVLVDDVITRGSTFVGMYSRLAEAFPSVEIVCYAAIRTVSDREVDNMVDPISGVITFEKGSLLRQP